MGLYGIGLVLGTGIGFVGIVVQNLIVYGMGSIPILDQNAPPKVALF